MEYRNGQFAIHPRFNKLLTALRTAVENVEGSPDKVHLKHKRGRAKFGASND
jgi:hypothetical protein